MARKLSDCTTQELIESYANLTYIAGCVDQVKEAKYKIKRELKRRFDATIEMLDDEQTTQNPEGTYKNILLGIYQ